MELSLKVGDGGDREGGNIVGCLTPLLAPGQVADCQTLATKPIDQPIALAA
jgi:hypothetical protein